MGTRTDMTKIKTLFHFSADFLGFMGICRGFAEDLPRIENHEFEPKNVICRGCRGFSLKKSFARAHTCEGGLRKTLGSSAMLGKWAIQGVIS
jgi:hypothetical protein